VPQIWAGVDIGKTHHHCVVLDAEGKRLLPRRVLNDEPELLALLADVLAIDEDAVWAVDVADGTATLLISVLLDHGQQLLYIPGLAANRASAGYRGTGKTDTQDATVIADQARLRRDLAVLRPDDEHAIELRVLTNRRADLNADRTRRINRLRDQLHQHLPRVGAEYGVIEWRQARDAGALDALTDQRTSSVRPCRRCLPGEGSGVCVRWRIPGR
jgi:transposase